MPRRKSVSLVGPHPVDVHIGHRLREGRLICRMSQSDLGKSVGVTFQQIQKYERGTNRISGSMLYEFAMKLNVPVSYFYEGLVSTGAGAADDGERRLYASSKEGIQIIDSFRKLPERLRKPACRLLEALAGDEKTPSV